MLSSEERRRLENRLRDDSINPATAILKCAAAILLLVMVAAGPWVFLSAGSTGSADQGTAAAPRVDQAMAESRRVFEERRRVYESARKSYASSPANAVLGRWPLVD